MSEKDFAVLVDYLSARSKTKSDIFDNFRQKKGNSFNIIISRSIQEAEAIRKELLDVFNKVSIINFPRYDESELKGIGIQMLNQKVFI